jgi:hypothetical protein
MQPCQVCGAAVDAAGYCTGCHQYRGAQSYAISAPAGDLHAPGLAVAPQPDPAAGYYVTPGYQSNAAPYPVSPSAPAYRQAPHGVGNPVPAQPARSPLTTPLFLLTVMVVVLVAGTVSVVLIKTKDRGAEPAGNASAAPAVAGGASSGPPPSAAPDTSSAVDRCVVGEWAVTSFRVRSSNVDLTTDAGGIFRLRADGSGTWDFGSGIILTGTVQGIRSEDLVTGRVDFDFQTAGQSFTFQNIRSDVREVLEQSGRDPVNRQVPFALGVGEYTCAGGALRLKVDNYDIQMGRK